MLLKNLLIGTNLVSFFWNFREISRFIAAGRLNCTIDKVAGLVITSSPDQRNKDYVALTKQGDALMASMQKLGRVLSY